MIIKNKYIKKVIFYFLIFSLVVVLVKADDLLGIYDIRESSDWISGQSLDLVLNKDSVVIFDVPSEIPQKCELTFTSLQRITKSAIFSVSCESSEPQSIIVRKDSQKGIDVNFDDNADMNLLLKKFELKEDKITISINKNLQMEKKPTSPFFVWGIILSILGFLVYSYLSHKKNNLNYKKIKDLLEQLENNLSLKESENAKASYQEIKNLYMRLTLKHQKTLSDEISNLFKQFEDENKK